MNRAPFRDVCVAVALTLLAANWLRAGDWPDDAGPPARLAASPPAIATAAAPADAPTATPAPVGAATAAAPVAEDTDAKQKQKKEEKKKGKDEEKDPGADEDAGADEGEDDDDKDKDKDNTEGKDGDVAGATIDRLRAFFPEKIGEFRRTDFHQYDRAGDDASVGYNLFRKPRVPSVAFTAYFYPARGDSLDADIKAAIRDVTTHHEEAEVGEPEVIEVTRRGKKHEGRRVRFKFTEVFGGKEQSLASELYLYPGAPGRLVKYRITFPAADAKDLQKKVDEFAESFPWPPGL